MRAMSGSALQFDVFMLFLNNKLYLILTIIGHTINQVEIWNGAKRPHRPMNLVSFKVELRTEGSKGNPSMKVTSHCPLFFGGEEDACLYVSKKTFYGHFLD